MARGSAVETGIQDRVLAAAVPPGRQEVAQTAGLASVAVAVVVVVVVAAAVAVAVDAVAVAVVVNAAVVGAGFGWIVEEMSLLALLETHSAEAVAVQITSAAEWSAGQIPSWIVRQWSFERVSPG